MPARSGGSGLKKYKSTSKPKPFGGGPSPLALRYAKKKGGYTPPKRPKAPAFTPLPPLFPNVGQMGSMGGYAPFPAEPWSQMGGPAPSPFQRYMEGLLGAGDGGTGDGSGYGAGYYYGGGGRRGAKKITWSEFDYRPSNAPAWWKAMKPSAGGPETEQVALMNMMIPFLSPQDQRAVAQRLATALPEYFGNYSKANIPSRYEPSEQQQRYMLSTQRASEAMSAASAYSRAMGKEEMGSPFQFMQQILGGMQAEMPALGERMSRGQYMGLMERMAPLYGDKSMGALAQMMAEPGYEQSILPGRKQKGRFYWGQGNPLLYR